MGGARQRRRRASSRSRHLFAKHFRGLAGWLALSGVSLAPLSSGAALRICVLHTALWLSLPLLAECALASLLPSLAQVEKWEAQREAGTYPGPVPGEKKESGGH